MEHTPLPSCPARRRVLVVDDCYDSAEMLAAFLRIWGHHPRIANDGRSALEEAARFAPEVALLDIGLPDLDGCQLARALRRARPGIVLVALTGYSGEQDRLDFANAGFDRHFVKPIALDALEALLSQPA